MTFVPEGFAVSPAEVVRLDAQASAGTAADRLVGTLEGDVDRLYQVAFAYQEAEQAAASRFRSRGRWGPRWRRAPAPRGPS